MHFTSEPLFIQIWRMKRWNGTEIISEVVWLEEMHRRNFNELDSRIPCQVFFFAYFPAFLLWKTTFGKCHWRKLDNDKSCSKIRYICLECVVPRKILFETSEESHFKHRLNSMPFCAPTQEEKVTRTRSRIECMQIENRQSGWMSDVCVHHYNIHFPSAEAQHQRRTIHQLLRNCRNLCINSSELCYITWATIMRRTTVQSIPGKCQPNPM